MEGVSSEPPDNDHPPQIIICSATGDWIEWEKPDPPEVGDCPHGGCSCTPTLYDQRRVREQAA